MLTNMEQHAKSCSKKMNQKCSKVYQSTLNIVINHTMPSIPHFVVSQANAALYYLFIYLLKILITLDVDVYLVESSSAQLIKQVINRTESNLCQSKFGSIISQKCAIMFMPSKKGSPTEKFMSNYCIPIRFLGVISYPISNELIKV